MNRLRHFYDRRLILKSVGSSRYHDKHIEVAQTMGAFLGMAGAVVAALFGSGLTVISWFARTPAARSALSICGSVLLFLTIPLLILGAYCLDGIEGRRR